MIKVARRLIHLLFWLQAFAAPLLLFALLSFFAYSNGKQGKFLSIVLLGAGVITGAVLAECIRRKYGLENFFSKIYASPGLDDSEKKGKRLS